jgi:phospholipid/cholesterol/gamma-HCH transport system permease protein
MDYVDRIAQALGWEDFLLLLLKTLGFGSAIAVITCYQGLARPLRLEQVPEATTRAVTQAVLVCVALDVACLVLYLFL